ncbi:MAG: LON peptidase substrate-binding domain-containing protein, partial [Pseudomonadota bacterium]|nr:LON peptidase substrate-binding domain-containing protein [Pseudomonadota bacterium]
MPAFYETVDDLPEQLPVFPLEGALLLPRGQLPLNIFEPRYLSMFEDVLARGRVLGIIQPGDEAAEDGAPLQQVGCVGRITSFSETEDGRMMVIENFILYWDEQNPYADFILPRLNFYKKLDLETLYP